ncbi:MAG TPA: hypothetical protein VFE46_10930 [Pirellulales bacterium]|nr:hypothetical protein [Pirellulales bacterium]
MLTVELLEEALELARRAGYKVRQEWLDGCAGGACVIRGQKWLFLDPTLSPADQLQEVLNAMWADPEVASIDLGPELNEFVPQRKAA